MEVGMKLETEFFFFREKFLFLWGKEVVSMQVRGVLIYIDFTAVAKSSQFTTLFQRHKKVGPTRIAVNPMEIAIDFTTTHKNRRKIDGKLFSIKIIFPHGETKKP